MWQDKTERWNKDCVGAMKKEGETVMCWSMIGYGWNGPFYVWDPETDDEKGAEREIARINAQMVAESEEKNQEWKASSVFTELKIWEKAAYNAQRNAEKNGTSKR